MIETYFDGVSIKAPKNFLINLISIKSYRD